MLENRPIAHGGAICLVILMVFSTVTRAYATESVLVSADAVWRFLDDGSDPGNAWTASGFDDSTWAAGPGQLGYGEGDETTVVGFGPNPNAKFVTTYFRHAFQVADPAGIAVLDLRLDRDDGAAVHLNGVEVWRTNLPGGSLVPSTLASSTVGSADEHRYHEVALDPADLVSGGNIVAVEVHQAGPTSSDLSMQLELVAGDFAPPIITRNPYLQLGGENSVTVRWRTDVPHPTRLRYGGFPGQLDLLADDALPKTEHSVGLAVLEPGKRTYYAIGTTARLLAGGDFQHYAVGAAPTGSTGLTRIWVQGDSGTGNATAQAVYDAFLGWNRGRRVNAWLMLGDNAYVDGTDTEFQANLFDMFGGLFPNTVVWPTFGNHDAVSSTSGSESGPYFIAFDLPRAGEAGGTPSGTEAYYSFDHGDVHFISLDSQGSSKQPWAPMLSWLQADLAANSSRWTVAFFHHSPYSKGSHDSDVGLIETLMRQHALPLLEAGGADLIMAGHSHSYERSFLLDGHHGTSDTLTAGMLLDAGDGDPNGDGVYRKLARLDEPNRGAVYVVLGSSGVVAPGPLDHPAMARSLLAAGSLVLEIEGGRLDGRFLSSTGVVLDQFTIEKTTECNDGSDDDGDQAIDYPTDPQCDHPTDPSEKPDCSDGFDNDGDGGIDFAGAAGVDPDPQCVSADDREIVTGSRCGLGAEIILILLPYWALRCRSRWRCQ